MRIALALTALLATGACQSATAPPDSTAASTASKEQGTMREIDIDQFKQDLDAGKVAALYDVRTPGEYAEGHVPGTTLVPLQELPQRVSEFEADKDKEIYLICRSGGRSARAAQFLEQRGYDVVNIQGGTAGWMAAGHPVKR